MFVFSIKADRKHLIAAAAALVVAVVVLVLAVVLPGNRAATVSRTVDWRVTSVEERVRLAHDLGYEVDATSECIEEIRVPDDPDATLVAYDALQEAAGLSLLKHSGKRVKFYTYTVNNTADAKTTWVHFYVYHDRVVAGDVTTAGPNGVQKGLM